MILSGCEKEDCNIINPDENTATRFTVKYTVATSLTNSHNRETPELFIQVKEIDYIEGDQGYHYGMPLTDISVTFAGQALDTSNSNSSYVFRLDNDYIESGQVVEILVPGYEAYVDTFLYENPGSLEGLPVENNVSPGDRLELSLSGEADMNAVYLKFYSDLDHENQISEGKIDEEMSLYWFVPFDASGTIMISANYNLIYASMYIPQDPPLWSRSRSYEVRGDFILTVGN